MFLFFRSFSNIFWLQNFYDHFHYNALSHLFKTFFNQFLYQPDQMAQYPKTDKKKKVFFSQIYFLCRIYYHAFKTYLICVTYNKPPSVNTYRIDFQSKDFFSCPRRCFVVSESSSISIVIK